jgi:hypothetical protein
VVEVVNRLRAALDAASRGVKKAWADPAKVYPPL